MKKDEIFNILGEYYKEVYDESPFKSIILDIRSILPKKGYKEIKKCLKYIEEIKELTSIQTKNYKNKLIKIKDDLAEKFKKNKREKKIDRDRDCYEYEDNKFYGLKDIRNLFDQNDDDIYEGIEYLFDESTIAYGMKQNKMVSNMKKSKSYCLSNQEKKIVSMFVKKLKTITLNFEK